MLLELAWEAFVYLPANGEYLQSGMDYAFFRDLGARWLADGSFYLPHQLAGSYVATTMVDVVYPPSALLLFVPAAMTPAVLWWAVPAGILVWAVAGWRPAPWAWFAIAIICLYPSVSMAWLLGSSSIWMAALTAATLRWGWPAALLAVKPFMLPVGILVIRRRSAWLGAAVFGVVSLAMVPLWLDYVTAIRNAQISLLWAARDIPVVLPPLVAWFGASQENLRGGPETRQTLN